MARKPEQPVAQQTVAPLVKKKIVSKPIPASSGSAVIPAKVASPAPKPVPVPPKPVLEKPMAPMASPVALVANIVEPVTEKEAVPQEKQTQVEAQSAPAVEGTPSMATVAPERAQAAFGDFNDRAKAAFEKSTKFGEEMTEFTKGNVEAVVASARIAAKGAEAMAQEAAEYSKKHLESATSVFKSFASAKSPTEFFQLHNDYVKSSFDSIVAEASKFSESFTKLAGEVAQPISNRYAIALEKIKSTAL